MGSRWPIRLLSAGLATWYSVAGLHPRRRAEAPGRILVAHNLLLGDTILLAPLLKKLRAQFPQAEIVMTCKPAFAPLFQTAPYGIRVIPFDPRDVATFWPLFRRRGFDLALLPADNRFSWLARALDSRWVRAFEGDRPAYKNWLVDEFRGFPAQSTAWGDLVADCLVEGPPPPAYSPSDWPAAPAAPFQLPSAPYAVLHAGASTPLKLWSAEKWRAVARHLQLRGLQPVLSCGRNEEKLLREIDPDSVFPSYPGTLDLPQLRLLVESAEMLVCPDTGIGHLARVAGTPSVILFGPGSPAIFGGGRFWKNIPGRNVTIPAFPCRNQNMIFNRPVPWVERCGRTTAQCSRPRCMEALTVEMVTVALDSLALGRNPAAALN